jgi:hypothetical protein
MTEPTPAGEDQVQGRTSAELLKATLRTLKMNQAGLCRRIGLSPKHVNQIAQGTVGITPDMALLLERATGMPALAWMAAELNRRRIQGNLVATRGQITCAVVNAMRRVGPPGPGHGGAIATKVALMAVEQMLNQLDIPIWGGTEVPHACDCGTLVIEST